MRITFGHYLKISTAAFFVAVGLLFTTKAGAATLLSFDDIKKLALQGNYSDAIHEIARVEKLDREGALAQKYDYYDVAMLDAECEVKNGSHAKALKAADDAVTLADTDQDRLAAATVFYVMIDKAKSNKYIAKTGTNHNPVNIFDPKARRAAYPLVYADEIDNFKQNKWKAKALVSLTPVLATARHFAGIRAIEHVVTSKTSECDHLGIAASNDVYALVTDWLKDRNNDADRFGREAAVLVRVQVIAPHGYKWVNQPTGLGGNRQSVINYIANCDQMPDALQVIDKGFGGSLHIDGLYRGTHDLKSNLQNLLDKYPVVN